VIVSVAAPELGVRTEVMVRCSTSPFLPVFLSEAFLPVFLSEAKVR
jgi:hypothetical protein